MVPDTMDHQPLGRASSDTVQLGVACALLVTLGVLLRILGYAEPPTFTFDEHHFVENARNYLHGKNDWNDHPPLGKLLIAGGITLLGDTPFGWRIVSLSLGIGTIAAIGALSGRVYGTRQAFWIAGGLAAADGFLISYSKTSLLDGQLTFFSVAAVLASVGTRRWAGLFAAGCLSGLACGIKMSGVASVATACIAAIVYGRRWVVPTVIGGALLTYTTQWLIGLHLSGLSISPASVVEETLRLYRHHVVLTDMANPSTSSWPTWFLPGHPLLLARTGSADSVRILSTMGNPLTWWLVSLTVGGCLSLTLWFGLRRTLQAEDAAPTERRGVRQPFTIIASFWQSHGRSTLVPLCGWVMFLAPWVLTRRDSYIYHYLPSYAFGVIVLAGSFDFTRVRRPRLVLGALCAVLLISSFYAPVWSRRPLTEQGVKARLFIQGWR